MSLLAPIIGRKPPLIDLREEVFTESSSMKIDREQGVIRGVKIIGRKSQRGHEYSTKAIQEAARHYEGIEVNIDHPDATRQGATRPIADGWGVLKGVYAADDGAYGDLHYLKEHQLTPSILERIDRGMRIGLSHNARGRSSMRGGKQIVESVPVVFSVDLVSRPATNRSLFESEGETVSTTIAEIVEALPEEKSDLAILLEEVASDPVMGGLAVEAPADVPADQQIKAGLMAAITAKLESADAETLKRVLRDLGIEDSITGNVAGEDKEESPDQESEAVSKENEETAAVEEEAEKKDELSELREQVAELKKRDSMRSLLESYEISPKLLGADRMALLESQADEEAMKKLIESWPPYLRGVPKPVARTATSGDVKKLPRLIQMR